MICAILTAKNFAWLRLTTLWFSYLSYWGLRLRGASVGPGLTVRGGPLDLYLGQHATVNIGAECRLNSGFAANPVGGFRRTGIWVFSGGTLTVGRNVGVSGTTIVCAQAITIEDDVYIGGDCAIYDTDFHSILSAQRLARPDNTVKTAPVVIQRQAFVGGHSLILKGVTIGEAAVIGAGSVVTKDVPAGEIWAGNPAKYVGKVG